MRPSKASTKWGKQWGKQKRREEKYAVFIGLFCDTAFAWGAKGHEFKSRPSDHFFNKNSQL